jgi:hypothetical protein
MEYRDIENRIYKTFCHNWLSDITYADFITSLNIGLTYKGLCYDTYGQRKVYRIVDARRWILAKLKYGI